MNADIAAVLAGERRWCVVEGDAFDILPTIPAGSVGHVITDAPYEEEAHTKARRALKDATQKRGAKNTGAIRRIDQPLEITFPPITPEQRDRVSHEWARISRRWVVTFCQAEGVTPWRGSFCAASLEWVRSGVWIKPNGAPQFTGDRPGQGFESIAIAHHKGRKRWNGGGKHAVWTCPLDHRAGGGGKQEHPTTKPIALMVQLVQDFTDPGELILDSYAGSGSTGVAALQTGRRVILVEKNPAFAALCRERLEAADTGLSLRDARAGQLALFATQ